MFLSLHAADAPNPAWAAIGYQAPAPPAAPAAPLALTAVSGPLDLELDACVIGSGAGGAVVAATLAQAGWRVAVLEAGGGAQPADFQPDELHGMQRLYLDQGLTSTADLSVSILAGGTLGGGTTVNWQTSLRPPDSLRDEWASQTGYDFFTGAGFERAIERVAARIGVGTAETVLYPNNMALAVGSARLGYHVAALPRNARGCEAERCGFCVFGCPTGAKQGSSQTFLRDAQVAPAPALILTGCRADRICIAGGVATGVLATATDASGAQWPVTVRCRTVVVAAGSLHSPAVLLRSGCTLPALGRNLHLHPTTAVSGRYAAAIRPWAGPPQAALSNEFGGLNNGYGFKLETAPTHPGLIGMATPWFGAAHYRRELALSQHKASIIVLARDRAGGTVTVDRQGRPHIRYQLGTTERRTLQRGLVEAARVHLAAGADEVLTLHTRRMQLQRARSVDAATVARFLAAVAREPVDRHWLTIFSAHQMGTCRIGSDRRAAVCDERGAVWDVAGLFVADGSLFPTASGVNPMLTIMALAQHVADGIVAAR